ncbi:hypothetical protein [Halosegnis longus]|uniref:hypothetical protein n=1 Tax=Halosegnis longus TaxID=2216012 RepID=UPI00129EA24B|nr:hypothetical protein [Halosegnis longus]
MPTTSIADCGARIDTTDEESTERRLAHSLTCDECTAHDTIYREYVQRQLLIARIRGFGPIESVSKRRKTTDFRIGDIDVWPDYGNDDHINAITNSSISGNESALSKHEESRYVSEISIHLPPAPEEFEAAIEEELYVPEHIMVHHNTGALGGTPSADGIVTPHILTTDSITYQKAGDVVQAAVECYENVYENGDVAIVTVPDS